MMTPTPIYNKLLREQKNKHQRSWFSRGPIWYGYMFAAIMVILINVVVWRF